MSSRSPDAASPRLEVRTAAADDPTGPPVLFVHGAYVGAWCWDEFVLQAVADEGYDAHAVSLRGHGDSDGPLATASLDDFVADVRRAATSLDRTPVLVGHSMGGVVVQRYLKRYDARGAALLASLPPQGMAGLTVEFALTNPMAWVQFGTLQLSGRPPASTRALGRALFSDDVPADRLGRYAPRIQRESTRALTELAGVAVTGRLPQSLPTLVLGAGDDAIVPAWAVEATARAFGTDATFVPGVAHAMMLDTGWKRVVDPLVAWLDGWT